MKRRIVLIVSLTLLIISILVIHSNNKYNKYMFPEAKIVGDGDVVIACVGDSITYGLGVLNDRDQAWVSLLAAYGNYKTINYGLSGRTLLEDGDLPYFEEELAKEFFNSKENKVLFMLGTNDSKMINWDNDDFYSEYERIVNKLIKKDGKENIYLIIPPKIFINKPSREQPNNKILLEKVKPIIEEIAYKKEVSIIDLYSFTEGHKDWFSDGLHPNKKGNKAIAKEIASYIN